MIPWIKTVLRTAAQVLALLVLCGLLVPAFLGWCLWVALTPPEP